MGTLSFANVSVRFGGRFGMVTAVDNVSLEVPHGKIVGLVGESGSGKSTLAKAAVGLAPMQQGQVLLDGEPTHRHGSARKLQLVFQDPYSSLDPRMRVGDSIAEALPTSSRNERDAEVNRLLKLVHLDADRARDYPEQLSGGQRQRIAIARALASAPEVIIADEITSALDVSIQGAILNLVRELQSELGLTMLFISHNLAVVRYIADEVAVMRQGRIVEAGPTATILAEPKHTYTRELLAAVPGQHAHRSGGISGGKPTQTKTTKITRTNGEEMNQPTIDIAHWQQRLDTLAEETGVPGAQLGILRLSDDGSQEELHTWASGILNANTGRNTTVDSLFQIGSISKSWTATVIMQLVEEGKIGLDDKVKDIIEGFKLSTAELTEGVTIRHLLNHTSGIDGDVFVDTGRGDDNLEKYLGVLETAGRNHPLGATWSYCNSGYSLLGRIIEVVTGQVWDAAMRERLFTPLGLTHTVTLPEEALLFDTAVGHVVGGAEPVVAPVWTLQRNAGPAGLITARIADLLAFARLHLNDGVAPDGTRVISPESAQAMRDFEVDVPEKYLLGDSWGLGFIRFDWGGARLYGHDGNTLGQAAFLRIYPEGKLAVGMLVNEGSGHELYQTIYGEIFEELAGVKIQQMLELPENPPELDITPWLGKYERAGVLMEILPGEDAPIFRATQKGELAELEGNPVLEFPLTAVREGLYGVYMEDMKVNAPVWFYQLPTGERYIHFGGRATPKVA